MSPSFAVTTAGLPHYHGNQRRTCLLLDHRQGFHERLRRRVPAPPPPVWACGGQSYTLSVCVIMGQYKWKNRFSWEMNQFYYSNYCPHKNHSNQ